jgi:hypothetical protein
MQKVVAYRLERPDLTSDTARATCASELEAIIADWLRSKGAVSPLDDTGTFQSQSRGFPATFRWQRAAVDHRSWAMVRLDEDQPAARRFETAISITNTGSSVIVYASLSSGTATSTVAPVAVIEPRCPRVVRDLLKHSPQWRHGATVVEGLRRVGAIDVPGVVAAIRSPQRTLPIIVVTDDDGELVLDEIDETLTHELAGLAVIVRADEQAAWEITKALGPQWACYYGGIRTFWPQFRPDHDVRRHPRWTPDDVYSLSDDDDEAANLLVRRLRLAIFRAAALNVHRPAEIEEIRAAHARARIAESLAGAAGGKDFEVIAESYAADNDRLRETVAALEEEKAELQVELDNAKAQLSFSGRSSGDDDVDAAPPATDTQDPGPTRGEERFYKKTQRGSGRDHMVRVKDCGHNRWQSGHSGDKAHDGIRRLEGRDDWRGAYHCGVCTGGGMWKVKW